MTVSGTVVSANPEICGGSDVYTPNYFALQAGSPALGTGSNMVASTVLTDFFGQSRQGSSYDIGAVERAGCNH